MHTYSTYIYFRQTKQYASCEIIATPMQGDRKPSAFGFQKDSPYLDVFNFYLKEMHEKGAIGKRSALKK